jgi:hypothetical protein
VRAKWSSPFPLDSLEQLSKLPLVLHSRLSLDAAREIDAVGKALEKLRDVLGADATGDEREAGGFGPEKAPVEGLSRASPETPRSAGRSAAGCANAGSPFRLLTGRPEEREDLVFDARTSESKHVEDQSAPGAGIREDVSRASS